MASIATLFRALLPSSGKSTTKSRKALTGEKSKHSQVNRVSQWDGVLVSDLNPKRLGRVFAEARMGEPDELLALGKDMLRRDDQFRSQYEVSVSTVQGLNYHVVEDEDSPDRPDELDAIKTHILKSSWFTSFVGAAYSGTVDGYSVHELIWTPGAIWVPVPIWRDPRLFRWDEDGVMRRFDPSHMLVDLEPDKYAVHCPAMITGPPHLSGINMPASMLIMIKSFITKFWMQHDEVHGIPIAIGKYPNSAKTDDINVLFEVVGNLRQSMSAVIPDLQELEIINGPANSGGEAFNRFLTRMDKAISKLFHGSTMTADDGASLSQAKVHENVQTKSAEAAAKSICAVALSEHIVRSFTDINFGPPADGKYYRIEPLIKKSIDKESLARALSMLVPLGFKAKTDEVSDAMDLSIAEEGDETLESAEAEPTSNSSPLPNPPDDPADGD